MNDFPNVPLSFYTEAANGRSEGMKQFASDLKSWLKMADLDLDFLSRNLGKSLGTIRNWMTGNVNVSDSKLKKIMELCQAHASGGRGVLYKESPNEEAIDYIWVKPYMRIESSGKAAEGDSLNEVQTPIRVPHGRFRILYDKWCTAAGVPEDTLYNQKALQYPALARFVTETIMLATQKALQKAQEEGKLTEDFITKENELVDMGAILQGSPCACSFFAGKKLCDDGRLVPDKSLTRTDICFFLPVIRKEWRGDFARLAAACSNYENTDMWIVQQLNQAALKLVGADLNDFITHRFKNQGK